MRTLDLCLRGLLIAGLAVPPSATAANHREAPITAIDHKADITDVYAFRSYEAGKTNMVTMIMGVDPLLEPANGPNYFPFDDEILYEIKVDNNNDAREDVVFQFRFKTEQRLPGVFQVYAGFQNGVGPVPPRITDFNSTGLGLRQSYTVTMIKGGVSTNLAPGASLYAVPANPGPRTMDYEAPVQPGHLLGQQQYPRVRGHNR